MKNKLYLVNPPDKGMLSGFPGVFLFLKAWLNMHTPEHDIFYLDLSRSIQGRKPIDGSLKAIAEELNQHELIRGAWYGITATTATYQNALMAARAIKGRDPTAKIILGGHHARAQAEIILENERHPEIDCCAVGEGEKTLVDLLEDKPYDQVSGLAFRDPIHGSIRRNPEILLKREELDQYQFSTFDWSPIRDSFSDESLRGQFGFFDITTARGCNLHCTFCAFGEDKLRDMSPGAKASLLSDMSLSDIYAHAKGVNIHDNDFAQQPEKTEELCDLILSQGLDLKWTVQTRVEHFDKRHERLVEKVARAGCTEVYFGVENFDPDIARYLKHVSNADVYLQKTREAVENTLRYGIGCNINLQLGVPGETAEAMQRNLDALLMVADIAEKVPGTSSRVTIYPQLSVVYPGTAIASAPVRGTNLVLPRYSFETCTQWEWQQEQGGFVEYLGRNFAHGNGGLPLGLIDIDRFVYHQEVRIMHEKLQAVNVYLEKMRNIAKKHPVMSFFDYSRSIQR